MRLEPPSLASASLLRRRWAEFGACLLTFATWVFLVGSDRDLAEPRRGTYPIPGIAEAIELNDEAKANMIGRTVQAIRSGVEPDEILPHFAPIRGHEDWDQERHLVYFEK